jgi:peptidoglycan/LPS O-acetylase OafA/YrhL
MQTQKNTQAQQRFGSEPAAAKRSYVLPGLDGLRALAVVLVLIYHLMPAWMPTGMVGVDVFFVISGFLITSLLLKEGQNNGYLNLPKFWVRRIRRLLPAVLLLVLVTVPAALAVGGDALAGMGRQVFGALSFTSNWTNIAAGNEYFTQTSPELFTHLWSLAVEEQFYVLWPVLLAVLLTLLPGTRRTAWAAGGIAAASMVAMLVLLLTGSSASRVYYGTDTHLFGLMAGATLALARPWVLQGPRAGSAALRRRARWVSAHVAGPLAVLLLVALSLSAAGSHPMGLHPWGLAVASGLSLVALIAVIDDASWGSSSPFVRVLELPAVVWIGQRSYGIYLWHWPVYVIFVHAAPLTDPLVRAALVLALSVTAAALSYRYVEQPIRQHGFGACLRAAWERLSSKDRTMTTQLARAAGAAVVLGAAATAGAVAVAPAQTAAQAYVQAGEAALRDSEEADGSAGDGPGRFSGEITGEMVTYIGDSVGVAASPSLLEEFEGIDVHAATSRFIGEGVDLMSEFDADGELREVVVVSLATNGPVTEDELDDLMTVAGEDRQVYLVNAHGPAVDWVPENNELLADAAAEHDNAHLVDWDDAISQRPELLAGDGVHPGPEGAELYVETLKTALSG